MTSPADWGTRLAQAIGPIGSPSPLGGSAWIVEAGGRTLVAKWGAGALDEANGLRSLRQVTGAPPVPEVVLAEADLPSSRPR
jgi:hypothetical protein